MQQLAKFSRGEIAPSADRHTLDADRADANPAEPVDRDAHVLHQATDNMVEALVDNDLEDVPLPGLAQNSELGRDNLLAIDLETVADTLHCDIRRASAGQNLILLRQLIPGMHDPVGDITVVCEEE